MEAVSVFERCAQEVDKENNEILCKKWRSRYRYEEILEKEFQYYI